MASAPYDPGTATTPRFLAPNLIACDSWRGKDASYVMDLEGRACSCPDFTYRKAGTGLLCKHLAAVLTVEAPAAVLPARPPIGTATKLSGPSTDAQMMAELKEFFA